MGMELLPLPHKWLMMFQNISAMSPDPRFQILRLSSESLSQLFLLSTQSHTCSQSITISTATLIDSRSTPLRMVDTKNSEKRLSELTRLQVTGSVNILETINALLKCNSKKLIS